MEESANTAIKTETSPLPATVTFDYIKSHSFHVVPVDGVIGGATPRLDIHMDFWSERFPIPQTSVHNIGADGSLSDEILSQRKSRDAIVREVEVGLVMRLDVAIALREWLDKKITEVEKILRERREEK